MNKIDEVLQSLRRDATAESTRLLEAALADNEILKAQVAQQTAELSSWRTKYDTLRRHSVLAELKNHEKFMEAYIDLCRAFHMRLDESEGALCLFPGAPCGYDVEERHGALEVQLRFDETDDADRP